MTVSEAAEYLGVKRQRILQYIDEGRFPGARKEKAPVAYYTIPLADVKRVQALNLKRGRPKKSAKS